MIWLIVCQSYIILYVKVVEKIKKQIKKFANLYFHLLFIYKHIRICKHKGFIVYRYIDKLFLKRLKIKYIRIYEFVS